MKMEEVQNSLKSITLSYIHFVLLILTHFNFRRKYSDKHKCYECGEEGHLSYKCPGNVLGARDPPAKKIKKPKRNTDEEAFEYWNDNIIDNSAVVVDEDTPNEHMKHLKYKKSEYLSDEEELV